jgi:anti-anti-sigma factor
MSDHLFRVIQEGPVNILELRLPSHAGSSLLGLMVNARQRVVEAGGRMALCGLSSSLMRIFTTCCLERLFDICNSRAEAVRASGR